MHGVCIRNVSGFKSRNCNLNYRGNCVRWAEKFKMQNTQILAMSRCSIASFVQLSFWNFQEIFYSLEINFRKNRFYLAAFKYSPWSIEIMIFLIALIYWFQRCPFFWACSLSERSSKRLDRFEIWIHHWNQRFISWKLAFMEIFSLLDKKRRYWRY